MDEHGNIVSFKEYQIRWGRLPPLPPSPPGSHRVMPFGNKEFMLTGLTKEELIRCLRAGDTFLTGDEETQEWVPFSFKPKDFVLCTDGGCCLIWRDFSSSVETVLRSIPPYWASIDLVIQGSNMIMVAILPLIIKDYHLD
jgi:hypothetical protein